MPNLEQSLAGGGAGLGSLFGLMYGVGQALKAGRMHPQRPTYEIPDETKQMLGLRENLLNAEMPGEQQARQDIATSQANAMSNVARGTSDQGQYLGLMGALQGQANKSYNTLATEQAQNYNNNLGLLGQAQRAMAAAKDKAFELNKYDPYLMQLQHKYQLQNAGAQNIYSGIGGLSLASMMMGGHSGAGAAAPINPIGGQVGLQGIASPFANLGAAPLAAGGGTLAGMAGNAGGLMGFMRLMELASAM